MSKNYSLAGTRSWSPSALKFVLGFLGLLLTVGSFAQVSFTQNFNANATGWTGDITRTTATTACGSASMRRNLYSGATTGQMISPSMGTSLNGPTTVTYKYKCANWSANTVGTNPWGSFVVQYGASATGPWTTLATVSQETQNGSCITKSHTFTPPAGALFMRWSATWTAGDYYINFDDITVTELVLPACTAVTGGTLSPSNALPYIAENFTLSATGATTGVAGLTYQWYSSPDDITYTPISGATGLTLLTNISNPTYFKREILCAGNATSAMSDALLVNNETCSLPTALAASASFGSLTISWTAPTAGSAPAGYNWELRTSGAAGSGATGLVASGSSVSPVTSTTISSGLVLGTTYTYYVQTDCGSGDVSQTWASSTVLYGYCTSTSSFGCADGDVIARIQLNTLDNNSGTGCPSDPFPGNQGSGANGPGYSDYTTDPLLTTALQAGGSYSCTVTAGQYSENYAAWVDYNDDLVFSPSERIGYTLATVPGSGVALQLGSSASFPINLLCNPPLGVHRMRVRCVFGLGNGSTISPCGNVTFGETEDYNIQIITPVSCPAPTAPIASNATYNSVDVAWTNGCTETAWDIEYGPTGFTPGTGTVVAVTSNPATVTGLSSVTGYDFYVNANCGVVDGLSSQTPVPASATTLQAPCAGAPDAGTLSSTGACSAVDFTLIPTGGSWTDLGLTYAWESSPDGSAWTDMGVATPSLTTNQTVATYYHRITTCTNSGLSSTSNDLLIDMNLPIECYCIPNSGNGCTAGDLIARVTLNTLDNNSGTACIAAYNDYTTDPLLTTTLQAGSTYSCTVYSGAWAQTYAAWVDYNDDGEFDVTERIGYTSVTLAANSSIGFPISLACNPPLGTHRLRVRSAYATAGADITPCGNQTWGEVEDYLVTISAADACPAPSGLVWTAATSSSVSVAWSIGCAESAWQVQYGVTGFTLGTGTTVSASSLSSTITGLSAETSYDVYVRADCGIDGPSTWVGPVTATTGCAAAPLTYSQGFNGGAPCWLVQSNVSGTATVLLATAGSNPTTSPFEGSGMLYFNSFNYSSGAQARAISAPLSSLTEASVDVEFQWRNENNPSYTSSSEGVQIQYSLDGTTWTNAGSFVTRHDGSLASGTAAWNKKTITLPPACAGQAEFFVGFLFTSQFGDNCFLDAAVVKQTPPCPAFASFTAVSTSQTTVDVTISGNPGDNAIVEYGPQGFTPGTGATAGVGGTVVSTSTLTATLTLAIDGFYDIYVRKDCSASLDGYSENSSRQTVNTYSYVPTTGSNTYTTCSATIYDSAITGDYTGESTGYTAVYPASSTGILTLEGTFDVDPGWDFIDIYEGDGTGGTLLASYQGTGTFTIQASAPNTPLTISFVASQWTGGGAGFEITASCQDVCTDIPGNAPLTGNASVCAGEPVGIELVTPEVGLTYIWQKRTAPGGTWVLIPGETDATLNTTQTVNTEYRARLGCIYFNSAGATVPTQSWFVTMNAPTTCYCSPTYSTGTGGGDFIQSVVSGTINNNTGAGISPFYATYPASAGTTTTYTQGGQYSITITPGTYFSNDITAWIDYNQDGTFVESERLGLVLNVGASTANTFNFTVPGSAVLGTTRLRVREADQPGSSITPCDPLTYGETEDYFVTMAAGAANDAPENATVIAPPIYPACLNLSGDLALATDDPSDSSNGADLWYAFTASSNACRVAVSGGTATNVEIEIQDAPTASANTVSTVNSQLANGNEILITDDLIDGSQYWVAIRNADGGTPGTFSVCIQSLANSGCDNGPTFAGLCSSFKADWTGTGSYTATFTSVSNPLNVYTHTTNGSSSWIPLTTVVGNGGNPTAGGLQYGESYGVTVASNYTLPDAVGDLQTAVAVNNTPTCTINILPAAPMNVGVSYRSTGSGSITTPGSNPRSIGSWVQTNVFMCGAIGYQWQFTEVDYLNANPQLPIVANTVARQIRLNSASIAGLSAGKRYRVKVAPVFAWGTGSYDEVSSYYVQIVGSAGMVSENNEEVVLVDKSLETGVFASLYPNPSNGELVNINIAGIESESVNIRIMDASGRTVWSNNYFVEGLLATTVNFDRPLAAGVYMVEMTYNGEVSTQRMVVSK